MIGDILYWGLLRRYAPRNDKGGLMLLAMTEEADMPCNYEKGSLRAKGVAIPVEGVLSGLLPGLRWRILGIL